MSRLLTNSALVVGSTLVSILLCELLLRVVGLPPGFGRLIALYGVPTREVEGVVLWKARETARCCDEEELERIAATTDTFKVVGLGDSIMFGVGLSASDTYLARAREIVARRSERPVEILNLAIPGYNTVQENAVYEELSERLRADLVIVHYWADDSRQYRYFGGYIVDFGDMLEDGQRVQALPVPAVVNDFLLTHSKLYALATHLAVVHRRVDSANDFARVAKPMVAIHERARAAGGRLLVLASPGLDGDRAIANSDLASLRRLAKEHGFEVIDLAQWLGDVAVETVAMDACHFNAAGHEILGERLAEYLLEHDLKQRGGG